MGYMPIRGSQPFAKLTRRSIMGFRDAAHRRAPPFAKPGHLGRYAGHPVHQLEHRRGHDRLRPVAGGTPGGPGHSGCAAHGGADGRSSGLFFRGNRKDWSANLSVFGRGLFVLVLFVPLMPEPWRIHGLLLIAALSQLVVAPVNVLWTGWMADLVPEKQRGRYFGLRNGVLGLVGTLGNLAAGSLIDVLGKPWGFLLVLGLGVTAGVSATFILRKQYEPPATSAPPASTHLFIPFPTGAFGGSWALWYCFWARSAWAGRLCFRFSWSMSA